MADVKIKQPKKGKDIGTPLVGQETTTGSLAGTESGPTMTQNFGAYNEFAPAVMTPKKSKDETSRKESAADGTPVLRSRRGKRGPSAQLKNASGKTPSTLSAAGVGGTPEPKISGPSGLVIGLYAILLDAIGVLILLIGGEDFLILDLAGSPINLYFLLKRVDRTASSTITTVLEMLPWVGVLPLKSAGVIATIYFDKHPKQGALVQRAAASKRGGVSASLSK